MNIGRIGTKADLKTDSFAVFESSFFLHRAIKLTQNCVCFTNLSINVLTMPSIIREYHPKVIELSDLPQCSLLPLTCSPYWLVFLERQNFGLFGASFHSPLVECSCKTIK